MIKAICLVDCTGNPVGVDGKPMRKAYQRGRIYEIDPKDCWAIHFRPISPEQAAKIEASNSEGGPSKYLEPKVREILADDMLSKFRIG